MMHRKDGFSDNGDIEDGWNYLPFIVVPALIIMSPYLLVKWLIAKVKGLVK